jgi:hypothetical protein
MKSTTIGYEVRYLDFDKSWGISFRSADGTNEESFTSSGFISKEAAENYMKGWNAHFRNAANDLYVSTIKGRHDID